MIRNRPSFFISSVGTRDEAIAQGLAWLLGEAKQGNGRCLIAVSQKSNLEGIEGWSQSAPIFQSLRKSGRCAGGGVTIELFTLKERPPSHTACPILAIYGGTTLLDAVDSIQAATGVLYIPWGGTEHLDWAKTWNAVELGSTAAPAQSEPLSGIAYVAIKGLTDSVNLTTGISHPSDKEEAIKTLETLFHKLAPCTAQTIHQQLLRLGWNPDDARKVEELAEAIWAGRRPKGSQGKADEDLWAYWGKP